MATLDFDSTDIDPAQPFSALPPGKYPAEITDSEMQDTKDGTGQFLKLELTVTDGEFSGRKLFDRLNLVNNNKTAEDIARRTLSAICHAVGVLKVGESEELHNKPLQIDVGVEVRKDNGENANRVKGYMPAEGAPKTFGSPKPAAPKPAASGKAPPPWSAKKQAA